MFFSDMRGPYNEKGRLRRAQPAFLVVESKCDYWIGEIVPAATKGSGGAVAATFCQIAPA